MKKLGCLLVLTQLSHSKSWDWASCRITTVFANMIQQFTQNIEVSSWAGEELKSTAGKFKFNGVLGSSELNWQFIEHLCTCPFPPWPDTKWSRAKRQKRAALGSSIFLMNFKKLIRSFPRQTFTDWRAGGCQTLDIAWLSPLPQLSGGVCGCLVLALGSPACELLSGSSLRYNTAFLSLTMYQDTAHSAGDFHGYTDILLKRLISAK